MTKEEIQSEIVVGLTKEHENMLMKTKIDNRDFVIIMKKLIRDVDKIFKIVGKTRKKNEIKPHKREISREKIVKEKCTMTAEVSLNEWSKEGALAEEIL